MGLTNNLGKLSSIITSTGSAVGIGTTSPSTLLQLSTARTNGTNVNILTLSDTTTGSQTAGFGTRIQYLSNGTSVQAAIGLEQGGTGTNNESQISFYTQNAASALTKQLTIASTGAATFTGDIIYNNAGNQNAIITSGAANNGRMYIYSAGTANIGLQAGGNSWFLNNLGIGTNSPFAKLSIGSPDGITSFPTYSTNDQASINWWYWASAAEGYTRYMDIAAKGAPDGTYGGSIIRFLTTNITNGVNPVERMRITSNGQIVMGRTTGSGGRLTVDGDVYLHNITPGAGNSTLKYNYTSTGLLTYDTSSRLLKKDIENLSYGLDDVLKMSAKKYKWKRDDSIDLGFIADEMVQIIPEIVFFSTEMTNETTGVPIGEPLSINYDRLIPVLVNAIQELSAQNQDLQSRLDKAGL